MSDPSPEPPRLPEIVDEAGDTPNWVPMVGLALMVLLALYVGLRGSIAPTEVADEPAPTVEGVEGAAPAVDEAPEEVADAPRFRPDVRPLAEGVEPR